MALGRAAQGGERVVWGGIPAPEGFRLVRRLGRGGSGEVWEAEAPGEFRVALKFVPLGDGPPDAELRALSIMKAIRHPNLVVTFGSWVVDDRLVIGMELADGTLWDRYQAAVGEGLLGVPRGELVDALAEAARGIDHLNEYRHALDGRDAMGIQHRDIKPQNLLRFGDGVKVADFGMARPLDGDSISHTGRWTFAYAAPEFFRNRTARQSDQYSLAATYCHLRTGRLPFSGSAAEVVAGHLMREPDLDPLPESERPIVARALAKDPSARWPNCRAFVEALCEVRAARPVAVAAPPPSGGWYDQDDPEDALALLDTGAGPAPSLDSWPGPAPEPRALPRPEAAAPVPPYDPPGPCDDVAEPGAGWARARNALAAATVIGLVGWSVQVASAPGRAPVALADAAPTLPPAIPDAGLPAFDPAVVPAAGPVPEADSPRTPAVAVPASEGPLDTPGPGPEVVAERAGLPEPLVSTPAPAPAEPPTTDLPLLEMPLEAAHVAEESTATEPGHPDAPAEEAGPILPALPEPEPEPVLADDPGPDAPADPREAERRAFEAYRDNRHAEAVAAATEALRIDPGGVAAYNLRGLALRALGRPAEAIADYDAAIRLRPADPTLHYNRGLACVQLGDDAEAVAAFGEAIRLDPGHARALRARAEAHDRLGDRARAEADRAAARRASGADGTGGPFGPRG